MDKNLLAVESRDPEYLEDARNGAQDNSDYARWNEGMPLADMECSHGSLPDDVKIDCSCWGIPHTQLHLDLIRARARLASEGLKPGRAALSTLVLAPRRAFALGGLG